MRVPAGMIWDARGRRWLPDGMVWDRRTHRWVPQHTPALPAVVIFKQMVPSGTHSLHRFEAFSPGIKS